MREQYEINKAAKVGEEIECPTCGTEFVKNREIRAFCKSSCKDKFHSVVRNHKPERYFSITANSCRRFLLFDGEVMPLRWCEAFLIGTLKQSIVSDKSISYRMENVQIGVGNPEWGAPLELAFILKVEL